jgi:hypothetical protein
MRGPHGHDRRAGHCLRRPSCTPENVDGSAAADATADDVTVPEDGRATPGAMTAPVLAASMREAGFADASTVWEGAPLSAVLAVR